MSSPSIDIVTSAAPLGESVPVLGYDFATVTSVDMLFADVDDNPLGSTSCVFTVVSDFEMTVTLPSSIPAGAVVFGVPGGSLVVTNPDGSNYPWRIALGKAGPWVTPAEQTDETFPITRSAWFVTDFPEDPANPLFRLVQGGGEIPLGDLWAQAFSDATDNLAARDEAFPPTYSSAAALAWPPDTATDPAVTNFPAYSVQEQCGFVDIGETLFNMAAEFFPPDDPGPAIGYEVDFDDRTPPDRLVDAAINYEIQGWAITNGQAGHADATDNYTLVYLDPSGWDPHGASWPTITAQPGSALAGSVAIGSGSVTGGMNWAGWASANLLGTVNPFLPGVTVASSVPLDVTQLGTVADADNGWMLARPGPAIAFAFVPTSMLTGVAPSLPSYSGPFPWATFASGAAIATRFFHSGIASPPGWQITWRPPRWRFIYESSGVTPLRQRQTSTGIHAAGTPLRQRQHHFGLRQRQTGI